MNDSFEIAGDTALGGDSGSSEASELSFVTRRELSSPARHAEEIKQMISDSQNDLIAAELQSKKDSQGRRDILTRCKQHETFSKSVDYDGN